ncbi:type II toxin-antitoxin system PemK/MazF family toxin [Candidatus Peregrinibacteria bacterium]|nr:type II toxin-antitoxin system PemK/MazF family toxin [Candidatus Peregrinibacteria bacterium]
MTRRGDVIIVQFPYATGGKGKNRPAVVIQGDRNNRRLQNTIVAMITGNTTLASVEPTQVLIDPTTPDGQTSGLQHTSAVKTENLFTIDQQDILRTIGHLPDVLIPTCI